MLIENFLSKNLKILVESGFNLPTPKYDGKEINTLLLTRDEYYKIINEKGKSHPSSAYQSNMEELNNSEFLKISEFPKIVRQMIIKGLKFQVRLSNEDHYGYIIGIFNEDNKIVAAYQDEWGTVLYRVAEEYRGFGLGTLLAKIAWTLYPDKTSGGFTYAGGATFDAMYREKIRDALTSGYYGKLIKDGQITVQRVKEIVRSAGLEKKTKKSSENFNNRDPKNWALYAKNGAFIIYDKKLKDFGNDLYSDERKFYWAEKMIIGYLLVRIPNEKGYVVRIGALNDKVKGFLLQCGLAYCAADEEYSHVLLYVDPDDIEAVDKEKNLIFPENMASGYKRFPVQQKENMNIDINQIGIPEERWRKSFDKYDEFENTVLEMADMKYRPEN